MSRVGVRTGGRTAAAGRMMATDLAADGAVPSGVAGAEAQLWAAVLYQVLVDLVSCHAPTRAEAETWIGSRPSHAVETVCALAGVEDTGAAHAVLRAVAAAPVDQRRGMLGLGRYGRGFGAQFAKRGAQPPSWKVRKRARALAAAGEECRHVG
ncbi:MAG: hypothetical protein BWX69_03069 [Planctomycetes bacterium ADurb.Bin069]|nr:MAG: hypothetical protein BWX69_03069 [Planctomycetes bacterium ADurb.Bin069]